MMTHMMILEVKISQLNYITNKNWPQSIFPLMSSKGSKTSAPPHRPQPGSNELLTKPELIKSDCSLSLSITQQPSPERG